MFSKDLSEKLDEFHLLKHPFYIAWNKGELSREIIKDYAEQYYNHVKAFPRYISATHSLCEDISKRKARTGRNPRTGESIQISASQKVKFLPAKALKEMFNK